MKNNIIASLVAVALFVGPASAFADSIVTASSGAHASVSPSGVTIVPTGATQSFIFGADTGYAVSNVTFDGSNLGALGALVFTGDNINHSINVSATGAGGGSTLPYCSGPMAPGWHVDLPGGGCGGSQMWIASGATYTLHTTSKLAGAAVVIESCPAFYPSGCMVNTK